ncbi:MAG: cyanoexosortase A [Xenococcaceae cyanobacterium MO_234.B1]|nr:cyanoexosortase A [Xenococcaceae cyanobacterium MO_234.B1]
MTITPIVPSKLLKDPRNWLLAIAVSLTAIYFNFCWITRAIQPLAISLIFFSAVSILLWKKRQTLTLESDLLSSLLGTVIITFVLLKISHLTAPGRTLLILPFIAVLGLSLLASGSKGFKQYWQELTILLALAIPETSFFIWWLKLSWLNYLVKSSKLWLLCLVISLTTIYLQALWSITGIQTIDKSLLVLLAVFWLVWKKRDKLSLTNKFYPSLFGTACLAFVLSKSSGHPGIWLQAIPFFSAFGIALIASGFQSIKQYWRELTILFVLGLFGVLKQPIEYHFALTTFTAQFANAVLGLLGVETLRQGTVILLPPVAAMDVVESCAGYSKIFWLVEIAIIYLVMFPSKLLNNFIVPLTAIAIAFISNGVRVAFLGVLLASSNEAGFTYWHHGEGSQLFSIIPLVILGLFCLYLIRQMEPEELNYQESSNR